MAGENFEKRKMCSSVCDKWKNMDFLFVIFSSLSKFLGKKPPISYEGDKTTNNKLTQEILMG